RNGIPEFNGSLPAKWNALKFSILFRERQLEIRIDSHGTQVTLIVGNALDVMIDGELQHVQPAA
ncbi:MAG: hypothetical protein OSA78_09440, partial [Flavobacteriales bacterium]|nr:hypothetical protein [Flavobacteriales bacterium]